MAYLFGLGRFFTATAALDTGSAFEGMGAAREVTFACLAEPALFLGHAGAGQAVRLAAVVQHARQPALAAHWPTAGASLALVLLSWFIVLLVENCRIPFDDPNTHLELTMIHEVMVLDHSGPAFGMILYGAALKLFVFAAIVVRLAVPAATGSAVARLADLSSAGCWSSRGDRRRGIDMARLRLTQIPMLLVAACLLSAFGILVLVR